MNRTHDLPHGCSSWCCIFCCCRCCCSFTLVDVAFLYFDFGAVHTNGLEKFLLCTFCRVSMFVRCYLHFLQNEFKLSPLKSLLKRGKLFCQREWQVKQRRDACFAVLFAGLHTVHRGEFVFLAKRGSNC